MNKRTLGIIAILLSLGLVAYWQIDGGRIYGVEQVQVEKVDELFGTVSTEWKDEPHVGLLPVIGPLAGLLLIAGIWLVARGKPRGIPAKV